MKKNPIYSQEIEKAKLQILISVLHNDLNKVKSLLSTLKPPKKGMTIFFETKDEINYYESKHPNKAYTKEEVKQLGQEYEHTITFIIKGRLPTSEDVMLQSE